MATRRNVGKDLSTEKLVSPAQGGPASSTIVSDTRPAVPTDVIIKLLAFTFAMISMPIGSYFFTLKFVFGGKHPPFHILSLALVSIFFSSMVTTTEFFARFLIQLKPGNSIYSGIFAAVMANVVLVAYIVVAMREDAGEANTTTGVDVLKRKVEGQGKKSD